MTSEEPEFAFDGVVVEWRGPAPFYFVQIPPEASDDIKDAARGLEYWGQVAVHARIGDVAFDTALFPKDGVYLLPLKIAVRRPLAVDPGDPVTVAMSLARR